MSTLDDLISQCQAAPDNDAPRLVWADAVGGERGELVIVQCRLASGAVTDRDEWRRLKARERELLAANGVAWSGLGREHPSSFVFRRGFIDALEFICSHDTRLDRILAAVPLARSVANHVSVGDDDFARLVANPRCTGFSVLHIHGDRTIQHLVDRGVAVRALSVGDCSRRGAHLLADSGLLTNVERLALRSVEDGWRIVSAAPRLRALYLGGALEDYAAAIPRTVVELGCHLSGGIDAVAALAIAPTLERLRVAAPKRERLEIVVPDLVWDFDALASFRALRSLDIFGAEPRPLDLFGAAPGPRTADHVIERRGGDRVLPALREISLGTSFDEQAVESVARAYGPQLHTLHWSGRISPDADTIAAFETPVTAGDAGVAAHVDGEFIVGVMRPWARRPLEFGDDGGGPWFEGGGVVRR